LSVGDVVIITDWRGSEPDDRTVGTIIEFDVVSLQGILSTPALIAATAMAYRDHRLESMCCVLWSHGKLGWILCDRLSKAFDVNKCKSLPGRGIKDVGGHCG
jgi:hypothetical protein